MSHLFTLTDKRKLQLRVKLSPSGRARFTASLPLGTFDKGKRDCDQVFEGLSEACREAKEKIGDLSLLDYPSQIQQTGLQSRPGWGGGSGDRYLSPKQKENIRETVAAIDREFESGGCKRPLFITFTLPSVEIKAFEALADYSSYAVNRLNTYFARFFGVHARCGVWEWQKRGALHYHCVIGQISDKKIPVNAREQIRAQWISILKDIQNRSDADMFRHSKGFSNLDREDNIQVDMQEIEKSAAGYLSKYLSKNEGKNDSAIDFRRAVAMAKKEQVFFAPPRWSNRNRTATNLRKKWTYTEIVGEFNKEKLPSVLGLCHDCLEVCKAASTKVILTEGKGYSLNNLYVIVQSYSECMDAIKDFCKEISASYCQQSWLWSGYKKYGEWYHYATG